MKQKLKTKKCKSCKGEFNPNNSLHKACSLPCALKLAQNETQKQYRKEKIQYRKDNETKPQLTRKAQTAFNEYIRTKDHKKPCISCESWKEKTTLRGQQMDAGHWFGVGAHPELRFKLWNCNIQCVKCNRDLSGNANNYRLGLIRQNGREWVEQREQEAHSTALPNYSKDDLRRIAKIFRAKTRLYKRLFRECS
jgi:hypothetical protein